MKHNDLTFEQLRYLNNITNILNLEYLVNDIKFIDVVLNKIHMTKEIRISLNEKEGMYCTKCGSNKIIKKGYQTKRLNHFTDSIYKTLLVVKFNRYKCKDCNSMFSDTTRVHSYKYQTLENVYYIIKFLSYKGITMVDTANHFNVGYSTISRMIDDCIINCKGDLPEVMGIDEIYLGAKFVHPYLFVIVDFKTGKIVDILKDNTKKTIKAYFDSFNIKQKNRVKFVTQDMSHNYKSTINECFPKARIAIDSFHIMKIFNEQIVSEMNAMRARYRDDVVYKNRYTKESYWHHYFLKYYRYILTTNSSRLKPYYIVKGKYPTGEVIGYKPNKWLDAALVDRLLSIDDVKPVNRLRELYNLKEAYVTFNHTNFENIARHRCYEARFTQVVIYDDIYREMGLLMYKELIEIIVSLRNQNHSPKLKELAETLDRWSEEILNSFIRVKRNNVLKSEKGDGKTRLNNGVTERTNRELRRVLNSTVNYRDKRRVIKLLKLKLNGDKILNQIKAKRNQK